MTLFASFEPGMEVSGTSINSVLSSLTSVPFIVDKYFKEAGLPVPSKINIDSWYSMDKWLTVFKLISEKTGSNTLLNIGKQIPENALFPSIMNSIEEGLKSIDVAYHMNHRNAEGIVLYKDGVLLEGIGHYLYSPGSSDREAIMICENPYPCDFDRGIITAIAQKFAPKALIIHDLKACRKLGSEKCIYTVKW